MTRETGIQVQIFKRVSTRGRVTYIHTYRDKHASICIWSAYTGEESHTHTHMHTHVHKPVSGLEIREKNAPCHDVCHLPWFRRPPVCVYIFIHISVNV